MSELSLKTCYHVTVTDQDTNKGKYVNAPYAEVIVNRLAIYCQDKHNAAKMFPVTSPRVTNRLHIISFDVGKQ